MVDYVKVVTDASEIKPVDTATFGGTPADDSITNAKLSNMAAWTLKLRNAASTGDPSDVAITSLTEESTPASGMMLLGSLADGSIRRMNASHFLGGGGGGGDFMADGSVDMTGPLMLDDGDNTNFALGFADHAFWGWWFENSGGTDMVRFRAFSTNPLMDLTGNYVQFHRDIKAVTGTDLVTPGIGFSTTGYGFNLDTGASLLRIVAGSTNVAAFGASTVEFTPTYVKGSRWTSTAAAGTVGFGFGGMVNTGLCKLGSIDLGIKSQNTSYFRLTWDGIMVLGSGNASVDGQTVGVQVDSELYVSDGFGLAVTPAAQQSHVADPSGGSTVDSEARTAINSILSTLETFGFHATS